MTNNKLPEWRTALDKCVENYQSTRAWYEENRDSPAALDDMERAEDQLANFVKKYGFSIVLSLLDEIDELQERRKADSAEPLAWTDEEELRDLRAVGFCEMFSVEPISKDADIRRVIPLYRHAQATLVVPPAIEPDYEVIKSILPTANPDEYACCIAADMWNACRAAMLQGKTSAVRAPKSGEVSCG
ncbi:hypothetical protein QWM80_004900 [Salmonella enterica]|nr:hypothetical protein [Salmonella enterica]